MELKAESSHKFFFADGSDRQLNFVLSGEKSITKAQIIRNSVVQEIKKTIAFKARTDNRGLPAMAGQGTNHWLSIRSSATVVPADGAQVNSHRQPGEDFANGVKS